MREVLPCVVSSFTPFASSPGSSSSAEQSEKTFGSVSRDGTWSWIAQGSLLEVFSVQTKERCSAYCFGAKSKSLSLSITAIEELASAHFTFPCLLVGLESACDGGLLCIVNVKTSKVISAIQLPYKVTSLEIVSSVGGAVMETFVLNKQLRYMFGVAAVGTEGGNVFLMDLCLDCENYNDETMPSKAAIVSKSVQNLPAKREAAATNDQHICIFLNDNNFSCDTFEYRNGNKILAHFAPGDVIVSALKYIRNLAVLVVGFNFGGIQLWNLQHLLLEISIPIHASQQPLVHFAFQEPENDPRNFCYLWSIRGHYQGENYRPENVSIATLYALAYAKREWIPRYGYFYEMLQSCTKRFEYALTSDPYNPALNFSSNCSRLIACDVISQADLLSRLEVDDPLQNEEWSLTEDLGLCLMAWENWPITGKKPSSSYLALFDINQWYQAQMPSLLRCNYGELCSYLGVFSLKEVSKKMDMFSALAISLVPSSLGRFKSSSMAEESFFPSSLSFKIWCMSAHGILQATYLGLQKQLLSEMSKVGPSILIDPKELYNRCLSGGLLSHLNTVSPVKKSTVVHQRETLLTLALEHSMIQFLISCVQSWKHIEFIHTGCSTKFMLDWVWKVVTQIKTSIDKLCLPLFDCSGQCLTENSLITLHVYKSRLKYLSDVIAAFQNLTGPQTELGQQELQLRKEVVTYILMYLRVLLWLYDCKLLPEHPEGEEYGEDEVAYPVTLFNKSYLYRRSELRKLHRGVSRENILLIDGLVEDFGESLGFMWEQKGGTRLYPPPSIYAAVSSYLIEKVSLSQKHMLMHYLLLDMSAYLTDRQSHLLEKLSVFCCVNDVSPSLNKLTQAFWYIDHQDFEAAMSILVDPVLLTADITSWQHARIVKSFLYQDQPQKALKYINVRTPPQSTKDSVQLHLSVLIANGLIGEAFFYLRQHQSSCYFDQLLAHVFFECQQSRNLDSLLRLPLSVPESSALATYLHSCTDPKAPELLIMYHLLRCQPLEAANLNEKHFTQVTERNPKCRELASARNALVSGFVAALPEEQKKLAKELAQAFYCLAHSEAQINNPEPLSSSLTSQALTSMSYADLLKNVINKVAATGSRQSVNTPQRSWSTISTTPFFRPAILSSSRKRKHSPGYPAATITPHTKPSPQAEEQAGEYSTPLKKSRSFDIRSFLLSDKRPMRTPLHESLAALLHTPPISRTASARAAKELSSSVSQATPLSILKTKVSSQGQLTPSAQEHLFCRTPSVCSEVSKDGQMSEGEPEPSKRTEDMQPRQLRFQESSPTSESTECSRSSRVSPRRPIHEEKVVPDEDFDQMDVSVSPIEVDVDPQQEFHVEAELEEQVVNNDDENFALYYVDSDNMSHVNSESSCDNLEIVYDSRAAPEPDVPKIDSCGSVDVSFVSINDDEDFDKNETIKANVSSIKECSVVYQVSSSEDTNEAESTCKLHFIDEVFAAYGDQNEAENVINQSGYVTPEKKEDSQSSSPYMYTRFRSRSKSVSPSRTASIDDASAVIPFPVLLLASTDASEKVDTQSDGGENQAENEINRSVYITPEKKEDSQSSSPYMYTRSRSRSKSISPSRKGSKDAVSVEIPISASADASQKIGEQSSDVGMIVVNEAVCSSPTTPEKKEDSQSSSPYMYTRSRSRSKSVSPSRTVSKDDISTVIPKPVALFTSADVRQTTDKEFDENEGCLPVLEAELPLPGSLSSSKKVSVRSDETPVRFSRSRTRAKSRSPARNLVPNPEDVVKPSSRLPYTMPILHQNIDVNIEDDNFQVSSVPEADLLPPILEQEKGVSCNELQSATISESSNSVTSTVESQVPCFPQEGSGPEYEEHKDENGNCIKPDDKPVPSPKMPLEHSPRVSPVSEMQADDKDQPVFCSSFQQEISLFPSESSVQKMLEVSYLVQETVSQFCSPELRKADKAEPKIMALNSKSKSIKKKRKVKPDKSAEKMPFTFSEPRTTPGKPEELQVATSTPTSSVTNFVFSPPNTKSVSIRCSSPLVKPGETKTKSKTTSLKFKSIKKKKKEISHVLQTSCSTPNSLFPSSPETVSDQAEKSDKTEAKVEMADPHPKSVKKKMKSKQVKPAEKMEFTFSKPHTPSNSEVVQVLSSTPSPTMANFVFSPPATRTRTRQKKLNETLDTSSVLDSSRIYKEEENKEFTFSKPRTPANSEVLQVLSSTPSPTGVNFVFSPPATRTRTRQRKLNETLDTSSMLDSSRICEEDNVDVQDDAVHSEPKVSSSVSSRKKTLTRLKRKPKSSSITAPQNYVNFISPVASALPTIVDRPLSNTRHTMTLRKNKKSVKLF